MQRTGLILLLVAGCGAAAAAAEPDLLPCVYVARATADLPQPELTAHPGCAWLDERDQLHLVSAHRAAVAYGDDRLAEVEVASGWYYVKPSGEALGVLTFDNGPDPFAGGLVRGRRDDKVAYFDASFTMVIPPRYDWGRPFNGGFALVCLGCTIGPPDGEHTPIVGGTWGWIDDTGHEVVPVVHTRAESLALCPINPTVE